MVRRGGRVVYYSYFLLFIFEVNNIYGLMVGKIFIIVSKYGRLKYILLNKSEEVFIVYGVSGCKIFLVWIRR